MPELAACEDWPAVWSRSTGLKQRLAEVFAARDAAYWVALLHAADLPAERIATLSEAVAHPQLAARRFYRPSPVDGATMLPLSGFTMSEGGPAIHRAPPRVGEHSVEILRELGRDAGEIEALHREGVIA